MSDKDLELRIKNLEDKLEELTKLVENFMQVDSELDKIHKKEMEQIIRCFKEQKVVNKKVGKHIESLYKNLISLIEEEKE